MGFTARATETRAYTEDDIIQFPVAMTNFGNYFNNDTGVFLCPHDGVYLFFSSLFGAGSDVSGAIRRDRTHFTTVVSEVENTLASNMAIVNCMRAQKVWIGQFTGNDTVHYGQRTTFSGYLLHRYYHDRLKNDHANSDCVLMSF